MEGKASAKERSGKIWGCNYGQQDEQMSMNVYVWRKAEEAGFADVVERRVEEISVPIL